MNFLKNLKKIFEITKSNIMYHLITKALPTASISYSLFYIYKYKKWFEVSGSYSSSTGKQMNNTRPTRWNSKIGKEMLICSKDEMAEIRKGSINDKVKHDFWIIH